MEQKISRPWYKKKRYLIPLGTLALLFVLGGDESSSGSNANSNTAAIQQAAQATIPKIFTQPQTPVVAPETKPQESTYTSQKYIPVSERVTPPPSDVPLSNDNYYTNSRGNEVHSPAYAPSVPAGASAICRDGTYSFSQSRRGTCSHHGGVAQWL